MANLVRLVPVLLVALFIREGSCLRCYQCMHLSEDNRDCVGALETPSKKLIVDCASQASVDFNRRFVGGILPRSIDDTIPGASRFCHKIVLRNGAVIRTCLVSDAYNLNHTCTLIDGASRYFADPYTRVQHCSACDGNECNSSGAIAVSLPLAFLGLVVSYFVSQQ